MKTSFKTVIFITILTLTFASAFFGGYMAYPLFDTQEHKSPSIKYNVIVIKETMRGREVISTGNLITNIGEQYARDVFGYQNITLYNSTSCISTGNATAAVTLTKLTTEAIADGFIRKNGTITGGQTGGDHYWQVEATFTATATTTINCVGLHWSGVSDSDNNLFACADVTQTVFPTGSNATVIWQEIIDAN